MRVSQSHFELSNLFGKEITLKSFSKIYKIFEYPAIKIYL